MRLHRFYVGEKRPRHLQHFGAERAWAQDKELLHQWLTVLKFRVGESVVLFDESHEILYEIAEIKSDEVALTKKTEMSEKHPLKKTLLAWSLLKRDNNDWILQKATEIGVTHFVPLISARSEKTGFDETRALKIVIEAAEQCGRSDIPTIDEPISPKVCVERYMERYNLYVADEQFEKVTDEFLDAGVLIGPEGGWTDEEMAMFGAQKLKQLHLGDLTLRAETAAIVAVSKLVNS